MGFDFSFTPEKLAACISNPNINQWYDSLVDILPQYAINTRLRVAGWLSQCGHESGDFKILQENLNYGAKGLLTVFPRYFPTQALAESYQRKPEMIANRVYGGRMGNGVETTGDGWKYRGRGLIQITGKDNYTRCSRTLYGDDSLLENPDLLLDVDGAIRSACWYWNSRNINVDADNGDVLTMTKKINGGTIGLDDRQRRYDRCMATLL
jgi:putative chitinase